jgi:WD40 repeat protein
MDESQNIEHEIPIIKPSYLIKLDELATGFDHILSRDVFAFGQDDGSLQLVDNKKRMKIEKIELQKEGIISMSISPNDTLIATGSARGELTIANLFGSKVIFASKVGLYPIEKLLWSNSSDRLFFSCGKNLFHIEISNFAIFEYENHRSTVTGLKLLNNELIGTTSYSELRLFESSVKNPYQRFDWKGSLTSLEFSPDERFAVCTAQDMSIHLWDLDRGKDLAMNGFPAKVKSVSFSKSGLKMACDSANYILIWDFSGKGPAGRKPKMSQELPSKVEKVMYSPRNDTLVSLLNDGVILFWNDEMSLDVPSQIGGIKDTRTLSLDWSKNGNSLVTTLENNYAVIYDQI